MTIPVCNIPTVPNDALVYNLSIVSLTMSTIFLLIAPTVELASFITATHGREGFVVFCIITLIEVHFFLNHLLYQKRHTKADTKSEYVIS